jgi:hypothetical protein
VAVTDTLVPADSLPGVEAEGQRERAESLVGEEPLAAGLVKDLPGVEAALRQVRHQAFSHNCRKSRRHRDCAYRIEDIRLPFSTS